MCCVALGAALIQDGKVVFGLMAWGMGLLYLE